MISAWRMAFYVLVLHGFWGLAQDDGEMPEGATTDYIGIAEYLFEENRHEPFYQEEEYFFKVVIGNQIHKQHKTALLLARIEGSGWIFRQYALQNGEWHKHLDLESDVTLEGMELKDADDDGVMEVLIMERSFRDLETRLFGFNTESGALNLLTELRARPQWVGSEGCFYIYYSIGCANACWLAELYRLHNGNLLNLGKLTRGDPKSAPKLEWESSDPEIELPAYQEPQKFSFIEKVMKDMARAKVH